MGREREREREREKKRVPLHFSGGSQVARTDALDSSLSLFTSPGYQRRQRSRHKRDPRCGEGKLADSAGLLLRAPGWHSGVCFIVWPWCKAVEACPAPFVSKAAPYKTAVLSVLYYPIRPLVTDLVSLPFLFHSRVVGVI